MSIWRNGNKERVLDMRVILDLADRLPQTGRSAERIDGKLQPLPLLKSTGRSDFAFLEVGAVVRDRLCRELPVVLSCRRWPVHSQRL